MRCVHAVTINDSNGNADNDSNNNDTVMNNSNSNVDKDSNNNNDSNDNGITMLDFYPREGRYSVYCLYLYLFIYFLIH